MIKLINPFNYEKTFRDRGSGFMKELQKKFDEYNKKIHSKSGIGELYERQIRYLYNKNVRTI